MTGTNHALTGANVALITGQWWAVPVAVASHFILDMLPHYGEDGERGRRFGIILGIDVIVLVLLVATMSAAGVMSWLVFLAMIAAIAPDVVWFYRAYRERYLGVSSNEPLNALNRLHKRIQWGERTWGWVLELSWFLAMISVLALVIEGL